MFVGDGFTVNDEVFPDPSSTFVEVSSKCVAHLFTILLFSPVDDSRAAMFGLPGLSAPPGPPGHKAEPGDTEDYSNMAIRVTDYIKCKSHKL